MKIVDVTAEVIETIWTFEEKGKCSVDNVKKEHEHAAGYIVDDEILSELERSGLVKISGAEIALTVEGKSKAQPIIRRHRLAERLLVDVLGMTFEAMEESACEYEHTLAPGLPRRSAPCSATRGNVLMVLRYRKEIVAKEPRIR